MLLIHGPNCRRPTGEHTAAPTDATISPKRRAPRIRYNTAVLNRCVAATKRIWTPCTSDPAAPRTCPATKTTNRPSHVQDADSTTHQFPSSPRTETSQKLVFAIPADVICPPPLSFAPYSTPPTHERKRRPRSSHCLCFKTGNNLAHLRSSADTTESSTPRPIRQVPTGWKKGKLFSRVYLRKLSLSLP